MQAAALFRDVWSARAEAFRASEAFGVKAAKPGVEFDQMNDHVHRVIDTLAPNDSRERFIGLHVRVIEGEARFLDGRTVAVNVDCVNAVTSVLPEVAGRSG